MTANTTAAPALTIDGAALLRHGEKHQIISGATHYFRLHPDLWEDRLKRLVAMGCNAVETYVAWNIHAPRGRRVHPRRPRAFLAHRRPRGRHVGHRQLRLPHRAGAGDGGA